MSFSREWSHLLDQVAATVTAPGTLFFRGQEKQDWDLVPALGRVDHWKPDEARERERQLYYDFKIHAGNLLANEDDSWRIAFLMQHHGLPMRLLDWSASFAIALHFAMRHAGEHDAVVWILEAERLNRELAGMERLVMHGDLPGDYHRYFISRELEFPHAALGLAPSRSSPRLQQQRGFFTLHRDLERGLEKICPSALQKIVIARTLFDDARLFLRLSGVNEFSLFPDLDGLARHLRTTHGLV
ncbi:MAG: hypothetical protein C0503_10650 [Gemmatimonas sp.]|nr:hypothetical protein [Gemmatimonas sp.]